jgi:hypothetical protein
VQSLPDCKALWYAPSTDDKGQERMPAWLRLVGPGLSSCALGVLGFAYSALLLSELGVEGKGRDLALFIIGALLLPILCAIVQLFFVRPNYSGPSAGPIETINCWAAVLLLLALASLPLLIYLAGKADDFWLQKVKLVVLIIGALHAAGLLVSAGCSAVLRRRLRPPETLDSRAIQAAALAVSVFLAAFTLFWIDPSDPHVNLFVRLFFKPPFSESPRPFGLGSAFLVAAFLLAVVAVLGWLESDLLRRSSPRLQTVRSSALCIAVIVTVVFYFDFSLNIDVFHYLGNVGPALHVLHGGTPMVDTFSVYGPGPVITTLVGLKIGPTTFGTAQITVQVFNFAFYALWLVCLYRMSRLKLPALLLGFLSVAVFLALYAHGYQNVNDAPSILGFRYLPALGMVLALSCLRPPRRFSWFTALSTCIAGLWGLETLIGTLGVHVAFLGLLALCDRAPFRLLSDGIKALLPAAAAVALMTLATFLRAGTLPDFGTYLQVHAAYNMLLEPWAVLANPMFYGWMAMLLAIFVVLNDAWMRLLSPPAHTTVLDDAALFYRFVPMTMLLIVQASYFAGRSIDATLDLAIFPFCALAIPAALACVAAFVAEKGPVRLLALIPVAIGVWVMIFTSLSLFRENYSTIVRPCQNAGHCASAPYSLLLHECRDHGHCSPAAIARAWNETLHKRAVIERVGSPVTDWALDTRGVVRDAVAMMETWAGAEPTVTVLLGNALGETAGDEAASELALMYAGKWHRWPRSSTLSDRLRFGPALAQRMAKAPVQLHEGELVLVRRSAAAIGPVEAAILKRIKETVSLCQLPQQQSVEVVAYRVAGPDGCASG